ncbi:putative C4-dicarboxylate response regulator DctR [Paenibacillus sp. J31TS4]|uniref:response regulator n=1 Tax=Paenibacillus sp. J31TS4 TaxID=2807195 RepID=UPI001B01E6FB|nr:response regulator [Paenibacillus sp. J31TS4]GIP39302.1 putative C4-dicarboxylate response regulator DctR [Paenibacillus sp. J31TS4]
MTETAIRVLLVEDDPMVQEVNRQFVERVPGFEVAGIAASGTEGLRMIRELSPELVILDVFMPSLNGLETLERLRAEQVPVDVIAITAAKDAATIQAMLRGGVADYIIKPFKFERVKQALEHYRERRRRMLAGEEVTQEGLDRLLQGREAGITAGDEPSAASRSVPAAELPEPAELPKGLNAITLRQIVAILRRSNTALSAEEVADGVGLARVTARRYLDYLEKNGRVKIDIRYGGVGRPVNRYAYIEFPPGHSSI